MLLLYRIIKSCIIGLRCCCCCLMKSCSFTYYRQKTAAYDNELQFYLHKTAALTSPKKIYRLKSCIFYSLKKCRESKKNLTPKVQLINRSTAGTVSPPVQLLVGVTLIPFPSYTGHGSSPSLWLGGG